MAKNQFTGTYSSPPPVVVFDGELFCGLAGAGVLGTSCMMGAGVAGRS
jgi:hypothetical protein